ncbi:MAG TPA: hypothetical protein PL124_06375 [Candidatus Cloacimonadota bacterium]|nr:hypothetical protein [Candidatus Cloacimonadota bacterium]HPS39020.1 hypothetical protein [Candidatus Cloacimonadota bacterium]
MRKIFTILGLIIILITGSALYAGNESRPQGGPPEGGTPPDRGFQQGNEFREVNFQGYLVDCIWGTTGQNDQGKDVFNKPSLITRIHLLSDAAKEAGYGIILQDPSGRKMFFRFDDNGNLMANDYLMNRCKAKNKIKIEVKGYMGGKGGITVTSLEKAKSTSQPQGPGGQPPAGQGGRPPMGQGGPPPRD